MLILMIMLLIKEQLSLDPSGKQVWDGGQWSPSLSSQVVLQVGRQEWLGLAGLAWSARGLPSRAYIELYIDTNVKSHMKLQMELAGGAS